MYQNGSNTTEQRWANIQQHVGYSSHAGYMRPRGSSSTLRRREQNLPMSMPWNQNFQIFVVGLPEWLLMKILHGHETWIFIIIDRGPQSNLIPFLHLISESLSFFFFSIWLNGYLMNCFSGTDRQSTTCSKIANSVVASSTLLGDIGSSSSSEMRGFNLGLSYPKEAMWNINAFY